MILAIGISIRVGQGYDAIADRASTDRRSTAGPPARWRASCAVSGGPGGGGDPGA